MCFVMLMPNMGKQLYYLYKIFCKYYVEKNYYEQYLVNDFILFLNVQRESHNLIEAKMTYFNVKSIFTLVFLTYYHVSAVQEKIAACNRDVARYFNGLENYEACAIKSLIFYHHADFEDNYGYLYYLSFRNNLRRGLILKPTEYCSTYFADGSNELRKGIHYKQKIKLKDDYLKTKFVLSLKRKRNEQYIYSTEYEFDEESQTGGLSQSIIYSYYTQDNPDIFECKLELSNSGFPDTLTENSITDIFYMKKRMDCADCDFVNGYLNHIALTIKIVDVDNPAQFCKNIGHNGASLVELLNAQLQIIPPVTRNVEGLSDPDIYQECLNVLAREFCNLKNYKEISDFILMRVAASSFDNDTYPQIYVAILMAYVTPRYTKNVESFCRDYSNRNLFSKMQLFIGIDENIEITLRCESALYNYNFPATNNRKKILKHAFNYIKLPDESRDVQYANIEYTTSASECTDDCETSSLIRRPYYDTTTNTNTNEYEPDVYLKAYMEHIKKNYHISSKMQSPDKFCHVTSKTISPRMHDFQ